MKNIHVLPTNKPSRLLFNKEESCYLPIQDKLVVMDYQHLVENQYIYITSDSEIKEEDWCLCSENLIHKVIEIKSNIGIIRFQDGVTEVLKACKKIILTTNQDLINDNVQAIDDEFLEWFVNNLSCEYVEVVKGFADGTNYGYNFLDYKIIIPK